ncbi:hypothetical protein AVEN_86157-1 [Araneus ventricosus]|uniref:Uncharacterized protein n=1 Tax=Araneus ventricosus TaxID=182803 RepID=A0A4Y2DUR3_ARAVE|nr:hypothetical protein AVEN_86157-1 [Araneus ventricosus]
METQWPVGSVVDSNRFQDNLSWICIQSALNLMSLVKSPQSSQRIANLKNGLVLNFGTVVGESALKDIPKVPASVKCAGVFDQVRTPPLLLEVHHWYRYYQRCQNRNIWLNVCCSAAPLVGGIEDRSALICVDNLRNAAYLRLFKLCSTAGALYMARNIFSPACEIVSGVD